MRELLTCNLHAAAPHPGDRRSILEADHRSRVLNDMKMDRQLGQEVVRVRQSPCCMGRHAHRPTARHALHTWSGLASSVLVCMCVPARTDCANPRPHRCVRSRGKSLHRTCRQHACGQHAQCPPWRECPPSPSSGPLRDTRFRMQAALSVTTSNARTPGRSAVSMTSQDKRDARAGFHQDLVKIVFF